MKEMTRERAWYPPPQAPAVPYVPCYQVTPGRTHRLVCLSHYPTARYVHYTDGQSSLCLAQDAAGRDGKDRCRECGSDHNSRRWYAYLLCATPKIHDRPLEQATLLQLLAITAAGWRSLAGQWIDLSTDWADRQVDICRLGSSVRSKITVNVRDERVKLVQQFSPRLRTEQFLADLIEQVLGRQSGD